MFRYGIRPRSARCEVLPVLSEITTRSVYEEQSSLIPPSCCVLSYSSQGYRFIGTLAIMVVGLLQTTWGGNVTTVTV